MALDPITKTNINDIEFIVNETEISETKTNELTNEELLDFLKIHEFEHSTSHKKLCFAVVNRIYRRVKLGYTFGGIKVCRDKNIVVDGNHRYVAYSIAGIRIDVIDATSSICDFASGFADIYLEFLEDWDANNPKTEKYLNDDFLID
ncbi:hypothetical protein [Sphingobacterium rhinopitheci]|uniref:hypothetical protein n=1 Tax=Sphingobacterium rhinopitheci TaxID=2781960 RepID=UPI001F522A55|nr:hypothetical protein [Sphingobacterium rhinopitheci]MCI0922549.1 hypothetical protein [Sphingobacterium rhinopitheci]